jgi:hypothetical protein
MHELIVASSVLCPPAHAALFALTEAADVDDPRSLWLPVATG